MENYTITEKVILPSKGKIYKDVPETLTLRSMTTEEEMRRLSQRGTAYEKLCDIIDKCLIEEIPISSYDMCLGDYQGLLYGLRIATYGSKCLNPTICPHCGKLNNHEVDLYSLKPFDFEDFCDEDFEIVLPQSKKTIKLKLQTPRILDQIEKDVNDYKEKNKDDILDTTFLFTLKHSIQYVDGIILDPIKLDAFLRKLPMRDTNVLMQKVLKLNDKVGINTEVSDKCDDCGNLYNATFRVSSEFFGPTID